MSEPVVNVHIDSDRVMRLGLKLATLLDRKSKGRCSRNDLLHEYWAARFLVLWVEKLLGYSPVMDNEAEVVTFYRECIDKLLSSR